MPTKLKIKVGYIEFEYEGDADCDYEAVKDLFTHVQSLAGSAPRGTFDTHPPRIDPDDASGREVDADVAKLSVQTVTARLGGKSAKDVALAAAAHLHICQGRSSFSRKDLLAEMQKAHGYYNLAMSKNLSQTLQKLVSDKQLMTMTGDQMSLSAPELANLKVRIAQS